MTPEQIRDRLLTQGPTHAFVTELAAHLGAALADLAEARAERDALLHNYMVENRRATALTADWQAAIKQSDEAREQLGRFEKALSEIRSASLAVVGASEAYGETESAHLWQEMADIAEAALWPAAGVAEGTASE